MPLQRHLPALLIACLLATGCTDFVEDPDASPGGSAATNPALHPSGAVLPTTRGRELLFRYPYVQQSGADQLSIIWGSSEDGDGTLELRREDGSEAQTISASKRLFSDADTDIGADFYQHEATITGLAPDSDFRYNVRHNGEALATDVPLHTIPAKGDTQVKFIVFGDSGTQWGGPRAVRDAISSRDSDGELVYPHDLTIGVGDIAYTAGKYGEFDRNFFSQLSGKGINSWEYSPTSGILSSRPFYASLGNHEYGNDWQKLPAAYLDAFQYPVPAGVPPEDAERYYSFDAGPVHFSIIDSMKFAGDPNRNRMQEMLDWVERDLADSDQPWKMAFLHHSFFSLGAHGTWGDMVENRRIRQLLLPILQRHGVQLVAFGHDHMYQRTVPLRVIEQGDDIGLIQRDHEGNIDNTDGIVYIGAGNGGAGLHNRDTQPSTPGSELFIEQQLAWEIGYDFLATRGGVPIIYDDPARGNDEPTEPVHRRGFTQVLVEGDHANITAYNSDGEVLDQFILTR